MLHRMLRSQSLLTAAAYVFLPLFLFHQADHIRRGLGTASTQLAVLGTLGSYFAVATLTLVFTRHRLAPRVATVVGFVTAIGFITTHWFPTMSAFSDSFVSHHVDWISWAASVCEVGGALMLGTAGLLTWRSEDRARQSPT